MQMKGLTSKQVISSRQKYGANVMPEPSKKSAWDFLLDVFRDKINMILLVLTVLFGVMAWFGYGEISEAIGTGSVVIIISVINVFTQMRSQRATLELRHQSSKLLCNVIRNGKVVNIDSSKIVVGDIVLLQAGNQIPADGYVVQGHMSVNNSVLNGINLLFVISNIIQTQQSQQTIMLMQTKFFRELLFMGVWARCVLHVWV